MDEDDDRLDDELNDDNENYDYDDDDDYDDEYEESSDIDESENLIGTEGPRPKISSIKRAAANGMMQTGKVLQGVGNGLVKGSDGIKKAGKITQKAGKGLYNIGNAMFKTGQGLCGTVIGALAGIPMMIAGIAAMVAGKVAEYSGVAMQKVIAPVVRLAGKALMKAGEKLINAAAMMTRSITDKAKQAVGAGVKSLKDKLSGAIPKLSFKKNKKLKIYIIIALSVIAFLLLFIIVIMESVKDEGSYVEGDEKNVPYMVSSQIMEGMTIVEDGSGKYTYAFKGNEGKYISLDERIDEVILQLEANNASSLKAAGSSKNFQKSFIRSLIKAEFLTQFPNISNSENLNLSQQIITTTGGSGNDYCVDMSASNALPACNADQLRNIVNSSSSTDQGKANMLSVVDDLVKYQEQYKVNAVFFMAVAYAESGWGANWDLIDSSTYNWVSIKGSNNGGYVDRNGTSWNKYNSYSDAAEKWFALISGGLYFGEGLRTIYQIAPRYCDINWGDTTSGFIEQFYESIGISISPVGSTMSGSASSATGNVQVSEKINQGLNIQGGIKIQSKDEDGKTKDLKYTSTGNFDELLKSKDDKIFDYYTIVKTSKGGTVSGSTSMNTDGSVEQNQQAIWNYFVSKGLTKEGVAGLMGNMEYESGFMPNNLENQYEGNLGHNDESFTQAVDDGTINKSEFCVSSILGGEYGYGLCQWTSAGRKDKLYDLVKSRGVSISDLGAQCDYLYQELQSDYSHVFQVLSTTTSIEEASNIVLTKFEVPADIENNKPVRYDSSKAIYDKFKDNIVTDVKNSNSDGTISTNNSGVTSLDGFLFIGDSRYVGIKDKLSVLGSNINIQAVSSSNPSQWIDPIKNGSGTVLSSNVTMPSNATGVSVMLGANDIQNPESLKQLLQVIHEKYSAASIFVNSVYYVGSNYKNMDIAKFNGYVDSFNQAMKDFCNQNSWAYYVDTNVGLHEGNVLKSEYQDGEGIHISNQDGLNMLVENIKNGIVSKAGGTISKTVSTERPSYAIVVAEKKTVNTATVRDYEYVGTVATEIGHGQVDGYGKFSETPASYVISDSTTVTYSKSTIEYQKALQNFTLHFDFLWAVLMDSTDRANTFLWAGLADNNKDTCIDLTIYSDLRINTNRSTVGAGRMYITNGDTTGINVSDTYSIADTTTVTTNTYSSKGAITKANTWLMNYENDAKTYGEYQSKSLEKIVEKTDPKDTKLNIIKIFKKNTKFYKSLKKDVGLLKDMIQDNEKISFMSEVVDYLFDITDNGKSDISLNKLLNTSLFDLQVNSYGMQTSVLLYNSLNITDEDKDMLCKAVEKICSDEANNEDIKKKVASVILNRALSSKFPKDIKGVLSQSGQFVNFKPSDLQSDIIVSDSTKKAVDTVINQGDCSKYSVYFIQSSKSKKFKRKYRLVEDNGVFAFFTKDDIKRELKRYETVVGISGTAPTELANKMVAWAEAQVGKSEFYNSAEGTNMTSESHCSPFCQQAYREVGLNPVGGDAKDLPHPNQFKFNPDGTIDYSNIPVGAVLVSRGVSPEYGHVALYIGNGYVIEAGSDIISKSTINESFAGPGHNCAPYLGWGFLFNDQNEGYQKLVQTIGGGNYPEGWTATPTECGEAYTYSGTGIQGYYKAAGKTYKVYCQIAGPYSTASYWNGTIGSSGCGISSTAIILTGYGIDTNPQKVRDDGICPDGTSYDAYVKEFDKYGVKAHVGTFSKEKVIENLRAGKPVILNVNREVVIGRRGYEGHYLTLLGMNEQGQIFMGDPGVTYNSGYFDQSQIFTGASKELCIYIDS